MAYSIAFSQAISIMTYIAVGSKRENCRYLSIKSISQGLSIPVPSVKRIVSILKRSGLLETKVGVDGGLALSRSVDDISFFDIFSAVEGTGPLFKIHDNFNFDRFKNKGEVEKYLRNEKNILNNIKHSMCLQLKQYSLSDVVVIK